MDGWIHEQVALAEICPEDMSVMVLVNVIGAQVRLEHWQCPQCGIIGESALVPAQCLN